MLRYRYRRSPALVSHRCKLSKSSGRGGMTWIKANGLSRLPGQGVTLCRGMRLVRNCAVGSRPQDAKCGGAYVAEDVDEDVVVISGPELDGLVVVPRQHIGGLEELSDLPRAHVLAALRRATQSVRDRNPGSVDQGRRDDRSSGIGRSRVLSRAAQRLGGSGELHSETRLSVAHPGLTVAGPAPTPLARGRPSLNINKWTTARSSRR